MIVVREHHSFLTENFYPITLSEGRVFLRQVVADTKTYYSSIGEG